MGLARATSALLLSCLVGLWACASSQFDGQVYRNGEISFRVGPIPSGWRQIGADQTLLAFRDDGANATVAVAGRCGKDGDDVPLVALTHHLFLQFTERQVVGQERMTLDGREALRTEMLAKLDGVQKHFVVFVLKKDGCVYDFMRISAGTTDSGVAGFDGFVHGFATMSST